MMRAFSEVEEAALLAMLEPPARAWLAIPPAPGKCPYNRLAALGCAQVMTTQRVRRARLTQSGRYFAELVRGAHSQDVTNDPGLVVQLPEPADRH